MLKLIVTKQFKKDLKKIRKQNKNISKLEAVVELILNERPLSSKYKEHKLVGNYKGRKECHIEPDWLLIYLVRNDEVIFERTGSHSELFE